MTMSTREYIQVSEQAEAEALEELKCFLEADTFENIYGRLIDYGVAQYSVEARLPEHYAQGFRFSPKIREMFISIQLSDIETGDALTSLEENLFYQTLLKMREDEETSSQRDN